MTECAVAKTNGIQLTLRKRQGWPRSVIVHKFSGIVHCDIQREALNSLDLGCDRELLEHTEFNWEKFSVFFSKVDSKCGV